LGQQFSSLLRIVRIKRGKIPIIGIAVIHEGADRFAAAVSHIQHFLLVNGMIYGLAYPDILQYGVAAINGHNQNQRCHGFIYFYVFAGFEDGQVVFIDEIGHIQLTGNQALNRDSPFRDDVHDDLI